MIKVRFALSRLRDVFVDLLHHLDDHDDHDDDDDHGNIGVDEDDEEDSVPTFMV